MSFLPEAFLKRMQIQLGEEYEQFLASFLETAPVSVRKNPFKSSSLFEGGEKVQWATSAYYLDNRISFTLDPLFHAGCYYVQEASSMFLEQAVMPFINKPGLRILDLCAAPGGKSVHLLSMMSADSLLVSNEVVPSRNKILRQNLTRWGCSNVIVTQQDAKDFKVMKGFFDVIVIDAPCSGEGLFRKDAGATAEWSVDSVNRCAIRQADILDNIIPALADNGILIYSTCTYEYDENDNCAKRLHKQHNLDPIRLNHESDGIKTTEFGLQFYPHKIKGEGFYISAFKKNDATETVNIKSKEKFSTDLKKLAAPYLENPERFIFYQKNDEIYAIPKFFSDEFLFLMNNFFIRQAGIHIGARIRESVIPSHQLALSNDRKKDLLSIELDRERALDYLRCKTISLSGEMPGWYLATFENHSIGWLKQLGNRMNNYLPKEIRILNL